ncbi:MAG: MBL fold metallo-hydrolase [Thermaceae bacterium]|nr:MBL fold metallo-hydrolase [Thermaceae bacterium]
MKLKWYGHAAFRLTSARGVSIITDPYTPETAGYPPIRETADMVIVSSDNDSFHCRSDLIPGHPLVINALHLAQIGQPRIEHGIEFRAVQAMEALNHAEHDPDQNGMYRLEMDGIQVGHMGDMGNALSPEQLEFFAGVDILLALAGGHPTLDLPDLKTAIDVIRPKWVIPMHFRTLSYKPRNTFWIESFLQFFPDEQVEFALASEVEISKERLPGQTRVWVLDYVRYPS